jgi:hypothetical protein
MAPPHKSVAAPGWSQVVGETNIYEASLPNVSTYNKTTGVTETTKLTIYTYIPSGSYVISIGTPTRMKSSSVTAYNPKNNKIIPLDKVKTEAIFGGGRNKNIIDAIKKSTLAIATELAKTPAQIKLLEDLKKTPGYRSLANIAPPPAGGSAPPGPQQQQPPDPTGKPEDLNTLDIAPAESTKPRDNYGPFQYPTAILKNGQDYLKFTILKYGNRGISKSGFGFEKRTLPELKGNIFLPIQPTIMDSNSVNWTSDSMNAIQLGFAGVAGAAMGDSTAAVGKMIDTMSNEFTNVGKSALNALKIQLANTAVSSQSNLLSRVTGAIWNPNMELLFQGPQLRPFDFSFTLTPRDKDEAKQVKSIIRAFKEASAVQRGVGDLFLKAPNVFRIEYMYGEKDTIHKSINRIKECALQRMSVNYTPSNTYMTYADPAATMTSYVLSLSFQELTPIYADDYSEITDEAEIGY